ncbi:MAG: hypothetical protein RL021_395 [Bacteroidota bacterium]|jgi:cytosine/adenosine deaminase-related metal-dependent hydrolase
MRFLQADRVYPVSSGFIPDGLLAVEDDGTIREVIDPALQADTALQLRGSGKIEVLKGWLIPGFINAHCHLELSWMKGRIPPGNGLPDFIGNLVRLEAPSAEEVLQAMFDAEAEMQRNGIVGVGDISNTPVSVDVKKRGILRYHTFVETFDLRPERAEEKYRDAVALSDLFLADGLRASVVPHSPYTVSGELMRRINAGAAADSALVSVHHQETGSEDLLFRSGSGELADFLLKAGAVCASPDGRSSFENLSGLLKDCQRILLVHNTYTGTDDYQRAAQAAGVYWWCLCPNANRYIENRLPSLPMFFAAGDRVLFGTDSLASNDSLSVLEEMKTVAAAYPEIPFGKLLSAATINAARFFSWDDSLGSFEQGKRPGVNLLSNIDPLSVSGLTAHSSVKAI